MTLKIMVLELTVVFVAAESFALIEEWNAVREMKIKTC